MEYLTDIIPDKDKEFYQQIFDSADDTLKSIIVGNVIPTAILGVISGVLYFFTGIPLYNFTDHYKWYNHVHTYYWAMDSLFGH